MGACCSTETDVKSMKENEEEQMVNYMPLLTLKRQLMNKLGITDDHFYQIFITYRFKNSIRRSEQFEKNIQIIREKQMAAI